MKLNFSATHWVVIIALSAVLTPSALGQMIDKNESSGSLWSDASVNPFVDRTARRVGDLLTILVSETSASTFSAKTTLSKSDSNSISTLFNTIFLDRLIPSMTSGATSSNGGTGSTDQNGSVTARMTAVVREIRPGGVLLVEAARSVMVNKELQTFRMSGLIRQDNIRADNTVLSETVADLELRMEGKGAIQDRQRRGLLTRMLDWLF